MTRTTSVAIVFCLFAIQSSWIIGCAGGLTLDQVERADETPLEESRVTEQQTRTFKVSVDGTERGSMSMQLSKHSDGTESVRGQIELNFNFIVYKYRYASSGTEIWKSGRLIELANEADHNGDKYVVQASAQQKELAVEVNGESQSTTEDVWVTSYWREPDSRKIGQQVTLLTTDKGQMLTGTLQRIGTEQIAVAENSINATHYQIRGEVEVDLWYDDEHRLIRQSARESGHRVLMELTEIKRLILMGNPSNSEDQVTGPIPNSANGNSKRR